MEGKVQCERTDKQQDFKKKQGQNEIIEMNEGVDCGLESPEH